MSEIKPNTNSLRRRDNSTIALEKFSLEETLGKGAYAKVKLAKCRDTGEKVAVKIVDKKRSPKDYLSKFLCREMEIATIIQHKNIIEVFEILETDSKVYFVMELAEGGDLLDYINKRGSLQEVEARRILGQLLMGLQHCHDKGVVHRDLKCENILLDKSDNIKLTDFGFARKYKFGQCLETFCGSYAYASPQILNGEPYDGPSTDIWSVGIMLYAMVNGRLPFSDSNVRTLLRQIHGRLQFSKRVSQECKQLIRKMLAIRTDERISINEIFKDPFLANALNPTAMRPSTSGLLCATPHSTAAFRETLRETQTSEVAQQQVDLLSNRDCNSDVVHTKVSENSPKMSSRRPMTSTPRTVQQESTQSESMSERAAAARKLFEPIKLPPLKDSARKTVSQPSSQRSWNNQKSPYTFNVSSPKPEVMDNASRPTTPVPPNIQITNVAQQTTPTPLDSYVPLDGTKTKTESLSSVSSAGSSKKSGGLFKKIKATFKKS